ncbi:MAG: DinB family protein [Aggregatilineales bacterium]
MNRIPKSWMISALKKSHLVLGMTIGDVSQEQAQDIRDGADGWTILEIMCHVRDFQEIFMGRATRILNEDTPTLVPVDEAAREQMIIDNAYSQQNLRDVYKDYVRTRHVFIEMLTALEDTQLDRRGIHPMTGEVDVTTPIFHTILHDADHTEQIARILGKQLPD